MGQRVSLRIPGAGAVGHSVLEPGKKQTPAGLTGILALGSCHVLAQEGDKKVDHSKVKVKNGQIY